MKITDPWPYSKSVGELIKRLMFQFVKFHYGNFTSEAGFK